MLPAQTYVKGFLRSYADYLGLDGQLYVDEFNSRYVRGSSRKRRSNRFARAGLGSSRGGFQGKAVLLTMSVIAGLTVFVFAAWMWWQSGAKVVPLSSTRRRRRRSRSRWRSSSASSVAGGSYLVVRRGTRTNRPIYSGTLESGTSGSSADISGSTSTPLRTWAEAQRPAPRRSRSRHGRPPLARDHAEPRLGRPVDRLSRRSAVLVTGSEEPFAERADANGPFLARS